MSEAAMSRSSLDDHSVTNDQTMEGLGSEQDQKDDSVEISVDESSRMVFEQDYRAVSMALHQ